MIDNHIFCKEKKPTIVIEGILHVKHQKGLATKMHRQILAHLPYSPMLMPFSLGAGESTPKIIFSGFDFKKHTIPILDPPKGDSLCFQFPQSR